MRVINERFDGRNACRILIIGPFGITLWRRGAVSFQTFGRFLQVVFGDWWKAGGDRCV